MRPQPRVGHSTGQGVGGNSGSGGPQGKSAGPSESEQTTSAGTEGRLGPIAGKPYVANGVGVGDAGMSAASLHDNPGKPSMASPRSDAEGPSERTEVTKFRGAGGVGEAKEPSRSHQGGRKSRSTEESSGNRRRGKGSGPAKENAEKTSEISHRRDGPAWSGASPTLYGRPPRWGAGAKRPSSESSALGERNP